MGAILLLVAFGAWVYTAQERQVQSEAQARLAAIARLKVEQIAQWRQARLEEGRALGESPFLSDAVARWMDKPSNGLRQDLTERMESLRRHYPYREALLVDEGGATRIAVGGAAASALYPDEARVLADAFASKDVLLTDLYAVEGRRNPGLSVVIPLFRPGWGLGEKIGALLLRIDTDVWLFPLIESWPVPSETSETLLVRRDGDSALFLNNLRGLPDAALSLRIPLTRTDLPAAQALLGRTGPFLGKDYRGGEVLAELMPVPGSTWFMVSKVDRSEAFAEWRFRSIAIVAMLVGTGVFLLSCAGFVLQRNAKLRLREVLAAERAQREGEARYHTTLLSIGDGVITTDATGRVVLMNPVAERLTGWPGEEARGRPLEEVFHIFNQDTRVPVENPMREVLRRGLIVGLANHTVLRARDGVERPIADSAAPIPGEEGRISGVVLVFRDQTQEYAGQKALRDSEARYRDLFSHMLDSFALHEILLDADGVPADYRFLAVNPAFERLTGLSAEKLVGRTVLEVMPGTERYWIDQYGKVALTGEPVRFQNYSRELDRHYEVFAYSPQKMLFACIVHDVTEQKLAELSLQSRVKVLTRPLDDTEQIRFEDLFPLSAIQELQDRFAAATGVASLITDPDGTPLTSPSDFCDLCADIIRKTEIGLRNCRRSDALLGRHNADGPIVQPCESCGLWDAGASITVGGRHIANWLVGQVRDETQTEDDARRYAREIGADEEEFLEAFRKVPTMSEDRFRQVAQALFSMAGQLSTIAYQNILQARFIADRKRIEAEAEKLQAQLLQAQKMESVGRLAGGIAHDFNNMLSVILGHSELALSHLEADNPLREDLEEINRAALRSSDITRQLLAFARKQTVAPRVIDLNQTLIPMLNIIRRLIGEDIDLAWKPGTGLGKVKIDPSQVDQILANLATNARDAISGVGKMTIETDNIRIDQHYCDSHPGFFPGDFVTLAVSDDGCGIEREKLSSIFDPFFTTKGVGQGTGLGLATVFGIVKQNGGFINVYSEPGHGATFKIFLPAVGEEVSEGAQETPVETQWGGTETILLVEDEESNLRLGKRMLSSMGYRVLTASSPAAALEVAKDMATHIDLLLTDVVMPGMNGRELARVLTKLRPDLKCLYMSGYTANVIAHRGVLDEGVNFIQKPYTIKEMGAKVRAALKA